MQLRTIMSVNVACVSPDDDLEAAAERMRHRGIHHLVVMERHHVVGVLTEREATRRLAEDVATVENAMFRHVLTGTPDMTVAEAAALLQGRPEGALPLLEGRRLVGIVTLSDLLDVLAGGRTPTAAGTATPLQPESGLDLYRTARKARKS